jgi:VWFA-related protein
MTHSVLAFVVLAWGLLASAFSPQPQQTSPSSPRSTEARSVSLYASVVDSKGEPVTGLTTGDFLVTEDGAAREVLKVGPATEPLQIALLVDDSQAATPAIQELREGLTNFIDAMQGKAEMSIITFGERPTSVVPYTTSADALRRGANKIFAKQGSGAYLLEAISDASRGLQKRNATRPVILAVTTEGVEFSSGHYDQVLKQLYDSGAALHVLALGSPGAISSDEMRNRNMVIAEGTARTGGRRDQLLSPQALPARMKQVAADLGNQYTITYARPGTLIPPEKVRVSAKNPTLVVGASTMAAAAK